QGDRGAEREQRRSAAQILRCATQTHVNSPCNRRPRIAPADDNRAKDPPKLPRTTQTVAAPRTCSSTQRAVRVTKREALGVAVLGVVRTGSFRLSPPSARGPTDVRENY